MYHSDDLCEVLRTHIHRRARSSTYMPTVYDVCYVRIYKISLKHARVYDVLCCIVRLVASGRVCRVHFLIFLWLKCDNKESIQRI